MGHYHSCGDNHGIRPPNPEQYLTPLQQKEVAIRHLKTKLLESDNTVHDRLAFVPSFKYLALLFSSSFSSYSLFNKFNKKKQSIEISS